MPVLHIFHSISSLSGHSEATYRAASVLKLNFRFPTIIDRFISVLLRVAFHRYARSVRMARQSSIAA